MDILVLLGSFVLLCALGLPVAYALGLSAIFGALWIDLPLEAIMLKISDGTDDFSLLAIPFFVLAGGIMAEVLAFFTRRATPALVTEHP